MISFTVIAKAILSKIPVILPLFRKAKTLREASTNPASVETDLSEEFFDQALRILGSEHPDDTLFEKIKSGAEAKLFRAEQFTLPHVKNWISRNEVRAALKRLARADIFKSPEKFEDRKFLIAEYQEISGEHESQAESLIISALAFLKAAMHVAANDQGTAALVQTGVGSLHIRHDKIDEKLDQIVVNGAISANPSLIEYQGVEAKKVLNSILKRRATPGQNTLQELNDLIYALSAKGKFSLAPPAIKAEIFDWTARLAGNAGRLNEAEAALVELAALGHRPSTCSLAWVEVARGHGDEALVLLRDTRSADNDSALFGIVLRLNGLDAALSHLASMEPISIDEFNTVGWANIIAVLARSGKIEESLSYSLGIPDHMLRECPLLLYLRGILCVANSVAESARSRIIYEEFIEASRQLIEGKEADSWRDKARESFDLCSQYAQDNNDSLLKERSGEWLQWLRLVNRSTRQEERAILEKQMSDPALALELIHLAGAFDVKFDPTPLAKSLDRAELLGGLNPNELRAKLNLLQHLNDFSGLAKFINEKWMKLVDFAPPAGLAGALIQAYAANGDCGLAEKTLNEKRGILHPSDIPRFELMIQECNGNDPSEKAKKNYEASNAYEDLENLTLSLERASQWDVLPPYANELFQRVPNVRNALFYVRCLEKANAPYGKIYGFLNEHDDLVNLDVGLKSLKAWVLYRNGEVEESFKINTGLLQLRKNNNDLSLDIHLAIRMGDWERLPAILDREWENREERPVSLMLHLAKLTASVAPMRSLQIVRECADRNPNDAQSLMQAYSVAAAIGRDDIGMPLLYKAAQFSDKDDGLIKSIPLKEVAEIMKDSANDWRTKNNLFRDGEIPIHWAASIFNVPLSRLLIAIPRENKLQADARRRQPIPIRAGNRRALKAVGIKRLALDITSIMLLSELGFLEKTIGAMEEIHLSPRLMETLLYESEKVRFHQPSRIAAAKPLLDLCRKSLIQQTNIKAPKALVDEIGEEEASLLEAARQLGGLCIHSGKLYRAGSFLEEEASLGIYAGNVSSPTVIAQALYDEGIITESQLSDALGYLQSVGPDDFIGSPPKVGTAILLDRVAAQYLSEIHLIDPLLQSGRSVFVHPSAVDEWQALADTEPHTEAMSDALNNIRLLIKEGMRRRKVRFLRERTEAEGDDAFQKAELHTLDFFEDVSQFDALCIDDRRLGASPKLEDRDGKQVDLFCCIDVIDILVEKNLATLAEREEAIHKMRESCLSALPLEPDELRQYLMARTRGVNGQLSESARLRVLREYLARLHSSNFLCSALDRIYLDELWLTGHRVLKEIWEDSISEPEDVLARANWVADHVVPEIELMLRFTQGTQEELEQIALGRLVIELIPSAVPENLIPFYADWLEQRIISPYVLSSPEILNKVSEELGSWLIKRSTEVANDVREFSRKDIN